jgi:hypothetical protein
MDNTECGQRNTKPHHGRIRPVKRHSRNCDFGHPAPEKPVSGNPTSQDLADFSLKIHTATSELPVIWE